MKLPNVPCTEAAVTDTSKEMSVKFMIIVTKIQGQSYCLWK